jgi:RimJ/RimL family protein N-acetyltransferase
MSAPASLPVGAPVDPAPAQMAGSVTLEGRHGRVERLSAARHGADLWAAMRGHDHLWAYLPAGPFADEPAFAAYVAACEQNKERVFYSAVDRGGKALGILSLMEISPAMRVVEVGNIVYSPALQRTPLATEAQYLIARYAFETLGYRRYEWKCNALNAASRRAAGRFGFCLRRHLSPAHDRQGPKPRHRLVLDARRRMASAQGRVRALACACEFRYGWQAESKARRGLGASIIPAERSESRNP